MSPTERFNNFFFALLISTILSISYFLVAKSTTNVGTVAGTTIAHPPVTVSFFFGGSGQFKLYGYTSPQALVNLESGSGYDETRADSQGYYEFTNRYSPVFPLELCLTAQDQFGRLSSPVCLPPFPNDRYIVIGPVILSPTLSFNQSDYYIGDEVILSGQTIPDIEVSLNMFSKNNTFAFIKPVEAFTFPNLATRSDSEGNFAISLPSTSAKTYRLFAQANYDEQRSPKSLTLQYQILPIWMIVFKFLLFIWSLIKSRLLEIGIIAQIITLVYYLVKHYFQPHTLMIRKHFDLILEEHEMVKRENFLPKLT